MSRKMKKVESLLGRIQFVDLAIAMATPAPRRKDHLRTYLSRALVGGRMSSYEQFRRAIPSIYGVERPLDLTPPTDLKTLKADIVRGCEGKDVGMNVEAAESLFNFIRPLGYRSYDHPPQSLRLAPRRKAAIRIEHYVVDRDRLVFQFVYPRRDPLDGDVVKLLLSMIQHSYAVDDYAAGEAEIVDMSCDVVVGPRGGLRPADERNIQILRLGSGELVPMKDMAPDIQSVHDLLIELGSEPGGE